MPLQPGSLLGPYEIVSALGAGGMGEVWKARDTRLDRIVAIKQLRQHSDRFEQEARAIAALNHPQICQIYDVGPDYLVLEYVEGRPIRGPLPAHEALRLAIQIAGALETAHARGIIHRDLKPGNVMVTPAGDAKLLDFGLAKLVSSDVQATRTVDGTVLGTAAYMSPEQADGKPVDARSDIFSFGAVLYEMLAGRRAFEGTSIFEVLSAVIRTEPQPIHAPAALERIARRCLAKPPIERFQTMAEVRAALEQASREPAKAQDVRPSIAVLPFANMSGDKENEYFSDGLAEEIINALAQIPDLKVIARTSAFAFKDKNEDVRRIAQALGVANILEGSVRRSGNRVRVTAQLITAADGSHLWSNRYDREMADIFAIQDEIAQAIAGALQVKLADTSASIRRHTPTLPAYEAVLKGRHHLLKHSPVAFARAHECFEQAMILDPQYAEPHAHLGLSYFLSAMSGMRSPIETMPLVRAEAKGALSLDPTDPGPHFLLASVAAAYDYDWKRAVELFAITLTGRSVTAEAHWAYASLYLQPFGRFEEAVSHMERAVERDPLSAFWRGILASHLTHAAQYDQAIRQANEALEIDETNIAPYVTLGEAYATLGRWEDAAAALAKGHRLQPQEAMTTGMLAGAFVRMGEQLRAEQLIGEMGEAPRPLIGRVLYHWLCSEIDQAADWYERAINERDPFALVFANGPMGAGFRQSPRWPKIAKMMNLPAAGG